MSVERAMCYSFDVFDTVITRAVARPADVFSLVEPELAAMGVAADVSQSFADNRQRSELLARQRTQLEDISLADIYREFENEYPASKTCYQAMTEAELQKERELSRPVAWTIREVTRLLEQGEKVLFISDTYLPADVICELLDINGVPHHRKGVHLSGEIGLTKATGNLFRHVAKKEQCALSDMVHFGDNFRSDLAVPHALGMAIYKTPARLVVRKRLRLSFAYRFERLRQILSG
jgi:predicted HAD superfamily hydrolase